MILLSFDVEEFDAPLEYDRLISFEEQMSVSVQGTQKILNLLSKHGIVATFYVTANFAEHAPELISRMISEGHEVASHGFYHGNFEVNHLKESREVLEKIAHTPVEGFRMARMMPVPEAELEKAGYVYNSSLNPTWIPKRYDMRDQPRTYFKKEGVWQLPASVSPRLRIPLFWLSFHHFPLRYYQYLVQRTYRKDGYLNLYFHPWEFMPIESEEKYNLPKCMRKNTGPLMEDRFEKLICWLKKHNFTFGKTNDFIRTIQ